jgi:hypothetical protein
MHRTDCLLIFIKACFENALCSAELQFAIGIYSFGFFPEFIFVISNSDFIA